MAGAVAGLACSGTTARERPCRDCDIPFQWEDGASEPPVLGPFPQGFAVTVPVSSGQLSMATGPALLDRYPDVAAEIGRCWSTGLDEADAHWHDLTLRVSFRRDGAVNGLPRIVHVTAPADPTARERGRMSLMAGLRRCTPLPFSASLGRAIAGQIFAIRFVQQRKS